MSKDYKKYLTASKLKNWLACNYTIINDINKNQIKKKTSSKTEEIRKKRGDEFEEKIFQKLKKKYPKNIKIKKDELKFEKTKEAINKGYDLIHKAYFDHNGWHGEIDFLIRDNTKKTKKGNHIYEVYDTKLSSFEKAEHIIQICIYSEWLAEAHQDNELSENMYLILGSEKEKKFKINDYYEYYKKNKNKFVNFLKDEDLKKKSLPEKCGFCQMCDWSDFCKEKWLKDDHLNQIANIRKDQIKKIKDHGIRTLKQFSELNQSEKINGLTANILKKHLSQAKLINKFKSTNNPEYKILPSTRERGFNKLPKPDLNGQDLFFDIEGLDKILNPEETSNDKPGLEYLFGIYNHANKKEPYLYFWAHNQKEEKKQFKNLIDYFVKHLEKHPDAHIYHYNHYERTALTKLMTKHDVKIEQVNNLLRNGKLVDLFHVVTQGLQVSETEYSLKNLEKFYKFKRSGEVQKANESTDNYLDWIETQEEKFLLNIMIYNREDCESTYYLLKWLLEVRPENTEWNIFKKVEERKKNWEKENEDYKKSIDKNLEGSKIEKILSGILGFHKREDMVYWQDLFNRASNKTDEELVEDAKCIGNMSLLSSEVDKSDKRGINKIFTYSFPKQEFKVKENDSVLKALDADLSSNRFGRVLNINENDSEDNKIKIVSKIQNSIDVLSIIKDGYVNADPIIKAVRRFVDSAIRKEKKYNATFDILRKSYPILKNKSAGDKIIDNKNFLEESFNAVEFMQNTYLYFQGPPGVGKTFTAAHIIKELLKKSKKIGISANSHKVIFNLLNKIEELSLKENFSFKGFHKPGSTVEKRYEESKLIKNTGRVKDESGKFVDQMELEFRKMEASLFSGTAWCFSRAVCDQKLDYIFIDEAGQLSVADVVAISLSAKNVVIIGDQMQLNSPSSAIHPNDSGKSVPEYLLEGNDTVSPSKGIFIDKSRRLHSKICNFTSNNFYDGRLKSFGFTDKRKIIYKNKETFLPETGIVMLNAKHKENCRQKSEEEGSLVKKLYDRIIGSNFEDKENNINRKIEIKDILTVAPFNVQVNHLKSVLPKNSRVGTIDIFQGQEAPVTIISMTSSDAESLPRNIDFFFSRNRLNVALSRSQCLSVIIMNKKLLEINCKKVEHIKLVNTFMKLLDYEKEY